MVVDIEHFHKHLAYWSFQGNNNFLSNVHDPTEKQTLEWWYRTQRADVS